jgi:hypothetical protein
MFCFNLLANATLKKLLDIPIFVSIKLVINASKIRSMLPSVA